MVQELPGGERHHKYENLLIAGSRDVDNHLVGGNESKMKMSRFIVCVALALALGGAGCERKAASPPMSVPEVAVVTIVPQEILLTTELPGRTAPFIIAEIRPQVSGLLLKRLFTEGSDIRCGEVLYLIDPAPFQAALDNAKAALSRSAANLPAVRARADRYQRALTDRAVSQQDYDDAVAGLRQNEADIEYYRAAVETARINLGYTKVTAPITGRAGISSVTDGAIVTAYQSVPLTTIQQLDPIYVDVPQSTTELLRLQRRLTAGYLNYDEKGQNRVQLILEDGTKYPWEGTLQFRDVSVDPTTGAVTLRMVFPNPNHVLLPSMFVRAQVKEGINEKAILVPQQGVTRNPKGEPIAYVVNAENKVELRTLTLDRAIGDKWLVAEGLAPGDQVIVEGLQRIRPDMPVKLAK